MTSDVPSRLREEQIAVEQQIRRAFRGVTRAGGVSWSESVVIDNHGSEAEAAAAREQDTEQSWEDLVDDPNWIEDPGIGGFNFLDPIGFAYYIAPAMIRSARRGHGEFVGYALHIDGEFKRELVSRLSPAQRHATARFVRFMIAVHQAIGDHLYGETWKDAYKAYWKLWDVGNTKA